jgi:taurine dioxygenase
MGRIKSGVMTALDSQPGLRVRPIAGALGAELAGIDLEQLDDAGYESLRAALLEHHVVFLPGQHLSPDAHRQLGGRFGELEVHPYISKLDEDHPEICVLNSDQGFIADVWHTDVTFAESPPQFSILNMREVPATGGDTMWTNQGLVYASLSEPIKQLLLGLTAVHTAAVFGHPEQRAEHPVVRRHPETGEPSLFVNRQFTSHITQLSRPESAALLQFLYSFSEQPYFTCRYSWTPGTIAIWDNRITQHYVVNDFFGTRVLNRVTVLGDRVEAYDDVTKWPAFTPRNTSAAHSGGTT